jgi:hypothetical protein
LTNTLGSDHYLISLTTPSPEHTAHTIPPPPQRRFELANWTKYKHLLEHEDFTTDDTDLTISYQTFVDKLNTASNASIPWAKTNNHDSHPKQKNHGGTQNVNQLTKT